MKMEWLRTIRPATLCSGTGRSGLTGPTSKLHKSCNGVTGQSTE
jgi:hypothetical protein